jgi:hypothetical protein
MKRLMIESVDRVFTFLSYPETSASGRSEAGPSRSTEQKVPPTPAAMGLDLCLPPGSSHRWQSSEHARGVLYRIRLGQANKLAAMHPLICEPSDF